MSRVGQNCIYTPYMTVCMVISLPKIRIYTVYIYRCMVLANPNDKGVPPCLCLSLCACPVSYKAVYAGVSINVCSQLKRVWSTCLQYVLLPLSNTKGWPELYISVHTLR